MPRKIKRLVNKILCWTGLSGKANSERPMFALLIGINSYTTQGTLDNEIGSTRGFPPLKCAVSDAECFKNYLVDTHNIPDENIIFLRDNEATRGEILKAFEDLANNERITKESAILIFYAGHGAQALPPSQWKSISGCPKWIELVIPHDYGKVPVPGEPKIEGIPDYTLAILVRNIAKKRSDNITIIFDCCHAASAFRGVESISNEEQTMIRTGPPLTYHLRDDLDRDIWGSTRGICAPQFADRLNSYCFFSACASHQFARERLGDGGWFTQSLIKFLRDGGADRLTCSQIVKYLPPIPEQNPQCEGMHGDKPLFQEYLSPKATRYFDVTEASSRDSRYDFIVHGGNALGLRKDDVVTIYKGTTKQDRKNPAGKATVVDFCDGAAMLQASSRFKLPRVPAPALLTQSTEIHLRLYTADKSLISRVNKLHLPNVQLLPHNASAHIGLSVDGNTPTMLRFDVLDNDLLDQDLKVKPRYASNDDKTLSTVLTELAHYYWHLKRTSDMPLSPQDDVSVSFVRIYDTQSDDPPRFQAADNERNLVCSDNPTWINISVGKEEILYGFKLTGTDEQDRKLFPVMLYFNNVTFTILPVFMPPVGPSPEAPWNGPSFTIGYGLGPGSIVSPLSFEMEDDYDTEVGFFKLFLSNQAIDFSSIIQTTSPFSPVIKRGLVMKAPEVRRGKVEWTEQTLTVVTRRKS